MIWLRTLLFMVLVPGTVLGWLPWLLSGEWRGRVDLGPWRWTGLPLLAAGIALMLWCFGDFVRRGHGTPAPNAPPTALVVAGPYRWVRNPMYVGGLLILAGQAVTWEAPMLLAYAAGFWLLTHLFVVLYEERTLATRFGDAYRRYRDEVPRWLPRPPRTHVSQEPAD